MEIEVNGRRVPVNSGHTVSYNWKPIRFSSAIQDEWSTEISIPNSPEAVSALDAYGLLDRGQLYNTKIRCGVLENGISRDGYLCVESIKEYEIKARVYIQTIPYDIIGRKVREYFPADDENTIFRWDRYTPKSATIAGTPVGVFEYQYTDGQYNSNILAQLHPSVEVQHVLSQIQAAEDITLPSIQQPLYQNATKKKVCPHNKLQMLMGQRKSTNDIPASDPIPFIGGQHITNDVSMSWSYADFKWDSSWTDWNAVETINALLASAENTEVKVNRDCRVHVNVYASSDSDYIRLYLTKNGVALDVYPLHQYVYRVTSVNHDTWDPNDLLYFSFWLDLEEGDAISFKVLNLENNHWIDWSCELRWEDYEITEDDWDTDLVYTAAQYGFTYHYKDGLITVPGYRYMPSGDGISNTTPLNRSFTYFGTWCNMDGDMSVRDYLTSLAWIENKASVLEKDVMWFRSPNADRVITANITEIRPSTDTVGRHNTIKYKENGPETAFDIDNIFLEEEKKIHESVFTAPLNTEGEAVVAQYGYENQYTEPDEAGNEWVENVKVTYNDLGALLFTAIQWEGGYVMGPAPVISGLGMTGLKGSMNITADTYDDIHSTDYVTILGHKYMLMDVSTDADTMKTTLKALFAGPEMPCINPQVTFNQTAPHPHSVSIALTINDITHEGTYSITIYDAVPNGISVIDVSDITYTTAVATVSAEEGSLGDAVFSGRLTNGFNTVWTDGLTPDSDYYVKVSAGNECGENEAWVSFHTPLNEPPEVEITRLWNITSTAADATVKVTEQ